MPHDTFDTYQVAIQDANELKKLRGELDNLYVALLTFVLTGDAFAAFYTSFDNWLPIIVTLGIGIFATGVIGRWSQGVGHLNHILSVRYKFLRMLEATPPLQVLGATMFSNEWNEDYEPRNNSKYIKSTDRLQAIFLVIFWVIPILLAMLTAMNTIPLIHQYAPQFILQFARPLSAGSSR